MGGKGLGELIPPSPSSPIRPLAIWALQPRTPSSPPIRHRALHYVSETLLLLVAPHQTSKIQLLRLAFLAILLPNGEAILWREGFSLPLITLHPDQVLVELLPNPKLRGRSTAFGDLPQLPPKFPHFTPLFNRVTDTKSFRVLIRPHPMNSWLRGSHLSSSQPSTPHGPALTDS